jgi:uncharacterized protein YjbI with pentapeptide repeats
MNQLNLIGPEPSNVFVQFLAGPRDIRDGRFGILLRTVAYATLVISPVLLLLLLQIQSLPYHDNIIAWVQRLVIVLNLMFIWWLWGDIISGRGDYKRWFEWTKWLMPLLSGTITILLILFSFFVVSSEEENLPDGPAIFPAKYFWIMGTRQISKDDHLPEYITLRSALFEGPVDRPTRRPISLFSNNLVAPGVDLNAELKIDDDKVFKKRESSYNLSGRNLQRANLTGAVLKKAALRGANLSYAKLDNVKLQGSSLDWADLEEASLIESQLQGATLDNAKLQGASLDFAKLQVASLNYAELQGSSLNGAQLQAASLVETQLQGASLNGASLQAAWLYKSSLDGAKLEGSNLHGAVMQDSIVNATDFSLGLLWRSKEALNNNRYS